MIDNPIAGPYKNIPKDLNDENLWHAMNSRISDIDSIRRTIKIQLFQANANNEQQKLIELKNKTHLLLLERIALHDEMKRIKERIKNKRCHHHRSQNNSLQESLAIEFMLIAQQKLPMNIFADIRNEAAMKIVDRKSGR